MSFTVTLSTKAERALAVVPHELAQRLANKLTGLETEPIGHDAKRVLGMAEKMFRVRVGQYRILYTVHHERREVHIVSIEKRSRAYD
jgi:mRNA interferase RelE/StbE